MIDEFKQDFKSPPIFNEPVVWIVERDKLMLGGEDDGHARRLGKLSSIGCQGACGLNSRSP